MAESPRVRILLAEDNRAHQQLIVLALTSGRPWVEVTIVDTGSDFLHVLRSQPFDCAVVDHRFSDYRAEELLEIIARDLHRCPTIVISGRASQDQVVARIGQNRAGFICKERAFMGDALWLQVQASIKQGNRRDPEHRRVERRRRFVSRLAENDILTGLNTPAHFERSLADGRWSRDRRQSLACALVDIDYLTRINDSFGQAAGDAVLKAVAEQIRQNIAAGDLAVRWGGGELLVIRTITRVSDGWLWAERLRQRIENLDIVVGANQLHATVSIGVLLTRGEELGTTAVGIVNAALSCAKDHGRNTVYTTEMAAHMRELETAVAQTEKDPEQRRGHFLQRLGRRLGPTQLEHLTQHCEQVSDMAVRMARQMGMSSGEIEQIRLAGLMHDIGKCLIPEELLAKPGPLATEERQFMAHHETFGVRIAQELGFSDICLACIRGHHMRHDEAARRAAKGGAASAPVPIGARVLCVADALVTMLSNRKYQPARPPRAALQELRLERGRQFDPYVIDTIDSVDTFGQLVAA